MTRFFDEVFVCVGCGCAIFLWENFEVFEGDGVKLVEFEDFLVDFVGLVFLSELHVAFGETVESLKVCRIFVDDCEVIIKGKFPIEVECCFDCFFCEILHRTHYL